MVFLGVFRRTHCVVAIAATLFLVLSFGISRSEAQINPIHGLPPPPPRVGIPEECRKSPENIIGEIEQGMDDIPDCGSKGRIGRAACCAVATKLSESGCGKVLDTAMRCCRLRFPVWMPSSAIDYACTQAMHQYGISDASEHCWRTRERRLNKVGCVKVPTVKQPQVSKFDQSVAG